MVASISDARSPSRQEIETVGAVNTAFMKRDNGMASGDDAGIVFVSFVPAAAIWVLATDSVERVLCGGKPSINYSQL